MIATIDEVKKGNKEQQEVKRKKHFYLKRRNIDGKENIREDK